MPLANGGKQDVPAEARECLQDCSRTLQDLIDQDGDVRTVRDNLRWSIAACQRAIDTMRSLEADLAHSPKRRRVSWEPAEADNEDCDGEPDAANAEADDPPDDGLGQARSGSDSADDDELAECENPAEHDCWALHLQKWPLPANHPEAGNVETLSTTTRETYVKWAEYLYRVNYWDNALHLLDDAAASEFWTEMDDRDVGAFWYFFPDNAVYYPETSAQMGND